MAKTPSAMVDLGTPLPQFELVDTISGELVKVSPSSCNEFPATVVMFICNHCPFVIHILDKIVSVSHEYGAKDVRFIAISSNDVEAYPDDRPELMKELGTSKGFGFPYLYDESQEIAKSFDATCTPDFFVYNRSGLLSYRGQFDGARPGNDVIVTGEDLVKALEALIAGREVSSEQRASLGCNIKWRG